jgi:AcrR family transcriptional regulator
MNPLKVPGGNVLEQRRDGRRETVNGHKRDLILKAAREVFETEGLEGASLRAIAARAGYTPAALYFHFDSKEALYAELLRASLAALGEAVSDAINNSRSAEGSLRNAAMAFFSFYAEKPRDLDLGFYLFRGGMKPAGLGCERDRELNAALKDALQPIAAAATRLGASEATCNLLVVDIFAHAVGLLLLAHTGRIRMFGTSARAQMEAYVRTRLAELRKGKGGSHVIDS